MSGMKRFGVIACLAGIALLASCASGGGTMMSPASPAAGGQQGGREPEWTRTRVHPNYGTQTYLVGVGQGNTRQAAELDAIRQLVNIFGVTVQADTRIADAFRGVEGGAGTYSTEQSNQISLAAGMDNLIGAEIGDRWDDGRTAFYALAVLNRANATRTYTDMIRDNENQIATLTNISAAEKNTFGGFSRFQFAAVLAERNANYAAVVAETSGNRPQVTSADDLKREAAGIANSIPIGIRISGDSNQLIQAAFAAAFTEIGFRTGGTNSRYVLNVTVAVSETTHPNPQFKFAQMQLTANLTDTQGNNVLLPYSMNFREGGANFGTASQTAFRVAVRQIGEEYADKVFGHLSNLLPKR